MGGHASVGQSHGEFIGHRAHGRQNGSVGRLCDGVAALHRRRGGEGLHPRQVVDLLNEYFPAMADIVFRYEGTLEKYIGDALDRFGAEAEVLIA